MEEKAGRDFDPEVVAAFARVFKRGEVEAPSLVGIAIRSGDYRE